MQWRMLARRCPSGSMTLVGDFGQASRPGALAELGRRARQPARAGAAAPCHAHGELPHPGRDHGGRQPAPARRPRPASSRPARCAAPARTPRSSRSARADLVDAAADAARAGVDPGRHGGGDRAGRAARRSSPTRSPTAARSPTTSRRSTRRSRCCHRSTPRASSSTTSSWSSRRGSSRPTPSGLRLLYVVLTRATRRLVVVHAEPLPEALAALVRTLARSRAGHDLQPSLDMTHARKLTAPRPTSRGTSSRSSTARREAGVDALLDDAETRARELATVPRPHRRARRRRAWPSSCSELAVDR